MGETSIMMQVTLIPKKSRPLRELSEFQEWNSNMYRHELIEKGIEKDV
jgi:hypothetical protein